MSALPYAEMAAEAQEIAARLPGSPISRGLPSRVPGTSDALTRARRSHRLAEQIAADPVLAAADPVLVAMAEAVQ